MSRTRVQRVQGDRSTPVQAATWRVAAWMSGVLPWVAGLPSISRSQGPPRAKIPDLFPERSEIGDEEIGERIRKVEGRVNISRKMDKYILVEIQILILFLC